MTLAAASPLVSDGGSGGMSGAIPSGLSTQNLLLDPDIRDWVVLPLLVIMISAGLLRHYSGTLLRSKAKKIPYVEGRAKSALAHASRLRGGSSNFITSQKWEARRRYESARDGGFLREEADWAEEEAQTEKAKKTSAGGPDMMNPMSMMEGMQGNIAFMVQNMVMMQGISFFFKGFILVKVPFPLTNGFKGMFQRGLDLTTLDTSYVSSVSWYFLVMFGLRAFFRLVIGDPSQETQESAKIQHDLGTAIAPAGPQQFDAPAKLRAEADNLELLPRHKSSLDDVEKRLLGKRYPKKKLSKSAGDDFFGQISAKQSKKKKTS